MDRTCRVQPHRQNATVQQQRNGSVPAVTEAGPTATTMATAVAAASDIAALKPATVAAREKYHPEDLSHRTRAKFYNSPNIRL